MFIQQPQVLAVSEIGQTMVRGSPPYAPPQSRYHIYIHPQIAEKLSLQPVRGEAKPYQIRQFLALAEKYHLKPEE